MSTPRPDGFYTDMPAEEYHAHPALGSTTLRKWLVSPLDGMTPIEPTDAMRLGSVVHEAIEDPAAWLAKYTLPPTVDEYQEAVTAIADALPAKLTDLRALVKAAGAPCSARSRDDLAIDCALHIIAEASPGVTLPREHYERAILACHSVHAHPAVAAMLDASKRKVHEASIVWTDERTGVRLKCRPDLLCLDIGVIIDWKTAAQSDPASFDKSAGAHLYHVQAAHYVDGVAHHFGVEPYDLAFTFVVVPTTDIRPERVTVRTMAMSDDGEQGERARALYERGIALRDKALDRIARFRDTEQRGDDPWAGYAEHPIPLSVPTWADRITGE